MSFSFSDFSLATEAGTAISPVPGSPTPSENVWLEFNVALDRKRIELEAALLRFLDEEGE